MMRRRMFAALALMLLALIVGGTHLLLPAGAQAKPVVVALYERNASGITGGAELVATDGATWITLVALGGEQDLIAYLHRGDCTSFRDQPAIPLALTTPGESSKTAVDVPLADLLAREYVIDLHAAVGDLATLLDPAASVACGEIGAPAAAPAAEVAAATQPPVTGIGPIQTGADWMLATAAILALLSLCLAVTCFRSIPPQPVEAPVIINVVALHRLRGLTK